MPLLLCVPRQQHVAKPLCYEGELVASGYAAASSQATIFGDCSCQGLECRPLATHGLRQAQSKKNTQAQSMRSGEEILPAFTQARRECYPVWPGITAPISWVLVSAGQGNKPLEPLSSPHHTRRLPQAKTQAYTSSISRDTVDPCTNLVSKWLSRRTACCLSKAAGCLAFFFLNLGYKI